MSTSYAGVGVSAGVVVGPVARVVRRQGEPAAQAVSDSEAEVAQLTVSLEAVATDLEKRAAVSVGEIAEILCATAMMARDPSLASRSEQFVRQHHVSAPRAVWVVSDQIAEQLAAAGGYMAERASDVRDVRDRVVAHLEGTPPPGLPERDEPYVLVADDLAPADTATLDPMRVLALVTQKGGPTGHTAIIARSLGLPAVVACRGVSAVPDGTLVRVDGTAGTVEGDLDPSTATSEPGQLMPTALPSDVAVLTDGHEVALLANVGDAGGARRAAGLGASGSGLYRTELGFLDRTQAPGTEEQRAAYAAVFAALPGRVVVRTLDAGADKPLPFLRLDDEPNPALGVRGLRVAEVNPQVLDDQLAAIAAGAREAGRSDDVWVMAPMVSTVDEAVAFRERCHDHGLTTVGVMVEVPSAALLAAELLEVVDFLSIGTNDLTQYTLAADRQSGTLAALNDPWQPAVLRLVRLTAGAGQAVGKPVGVCGEAAADPDLAAVLVGLGVTSLSADAAALGAVHTRLCGLDLERCRRAGEAAAGAGSATAAREAAAAQLDGGPP